MSNTRTSRVGSIIAFTLSGLFIVLAGWIFLNRQFALDQLAVWSYEPTAAVTTINERVQFTDKGTFIFYATKPLVAAQADFNEKCPRQEAGSPILGCYTNEDRIYIYDLTNEQLNGIEEVTAAHEMLHAVWYRTSNEEREKLSGELRKAYEKLDNKELDQRMQYYERTEPGELANELHSILGTEVASLGEPLESYYAQFFDRAAVLKLHGQYNDLYTSLNERADTLYASMESLGASIQSQSTAYDTAVNQYGADVSAFNARANGGGFATQSQFIQERAQLVARSDALDTQRQQINNDIATYNNYYNEYQKIADQIEVLNSSLDSFKQLEQAPSV